MLVEDVLSHDRPGTQTGPFGSSLKRHEYVGNGIPVWGINNLGDGDLVEVGSLFITPEKYRDLSGYSVEDGDILISRAGTVGRMCVAHPSVRPSIIGTNLVRVALDTTVITSEYFASVFNYFGNRIGRLRMSGDENAYSFLNPSVLRMLKIPLPDISVQNQFLKVMRKHQRLRIQQREAERQAEQLFQALLKRAFLGAL